MSSPSSPAARAPSGRAAHVQLRTSGRVSPEHEKEIDELAMEVRAEEAALAKLQEAAGCATDSSASSALRVMQLPLEQEEGGPPERAKPRLSSRKGGGLIGAARRRARAALAPFFSIRTLFILSAILQVLGAVAVTFCLLWFMTRRNVDDIVTTLIRNLQTRAYEIVKAYLQAATVVADGLARDVEAGHLSRGSWRMVLDELDHHLASVPSIAFNGIRYNDGYYVGQESCATSEPGGLCDTGRRAVFGNATHILTYEAGSRGQPTRYVSTTPIQSFIAPWYNAVTRSATGCLWFGVRYVYVGTPALGATLADPLDGMVVSYASAFRELPTLDSELPSGGALPGTLGGTPTSEPATPAEFFARESQGPGSTPYRGVSAVSIRLGAISRRLLEAVQYEGTLLLITTPEGKMVATSTREVSQVINDQMEPIAASESPHAVTRDLVRQFAAGAHAGETGTVIFRSEGGEFFGSRAAIRLEPNLDLVLYTAVSQDVILSELRRGRNIAFGVCGAWLALSVLAAGIASWLITRPIDKIKVSMSILLDTMTNVYAELRMHVDPEQEWTREPAARPRRSRSKSSGQGRSGSTSSTGSAVQSGIRELTAFDDLVADMHSRFVAFQEVVSMEAKLKIEMEVRSQETKKFLATVSHEMRTPLNGILGMLDLARECPLPPDAVDYVESAAISGEHLLALVNDILDLQKMEAGLIELSSVPVDVRASVVSAVRIVKRKADEKGLQVGMDVADEVPPLLAADPDRLRQVLLNLLSNAVKYTNDGSVQIRVRLPERPATPPALPTPLETPRGAAAGGARRPERLIVRFEVQDTGPGIAEEHQRSLFQRFYRVQHLPGTQADPGGTGLGLAISREIVEKAGGRIGCLSAPGQGSTFWFEIPCGRTPVPGDASPLRIVSARHSQASGGFPGSARPSVLGSARPSARAFTLAATAAVAAATAAAPLSSARRSRPASPAAASSSVDEGTSTLSPSAAAAPLRILVAEDNAMNARVITSMLRREGHAVTLTSDGAEAALAFEEGLSAAAPGATAFDIVFMDCLMPVCDGFEATARIRRLEVERGAPRHLVVALTAKAGSEDEAECRAAGMDAFLPKPVRRATLAAFVGGRPGGSEATLSGSPLPRPSAALAAGGMAEALGPEGGEMPLGGRGGLLENPPPSSGRSFGPEPAARPRPAPAALAPTRSAAQPAPTLPGSLADVGDPPKTAPAVEAGFRSLGGAAPAKELASAGPTAPEAPLRPVESPPESPRRPRAGSVRRPSKSLGAAADLDPDADLSDAPKPTGPRSAPSLASPSSAALVPPLHLLVVDDVEMNRRVLGSLLEKEGHNVTLACDGQEAVEEFERRAREAAPDRPPFALVFMDVSMPVMDGYTATRRIRHVEEGLRGVGGRGVPRTPVVACTALNSSKDREDMAEAGMDDLVVKPVVRPVVRAVLAKWRGGQKSDAPPKPNGPDGVGDAL